MDPARWERVKDVFQDVFERAPAERAEQLDRACADDPECRAEVERLLRAHARASGFLDASPHLWPLQAYRQPRAWPSLAFSRQRSRPSRCDAW